jgi:hypothetical protein
MTICTLPLILLEQLNKEGSDGYSMQHEEQCFYYKTSMEENNWKKEAQKGGKY